MALVKLARRADYKARSDEIHKFRHAYSLTAGRFAELLDYADMEHNVSADRPEGFCSLYLPKQKVIDTASDPDTARKMVALRDATSVREIALLCEIDNSFKILLELVIKISSGLKFSSLVSILKNLHKAL